jgi:hypothetical protein
MSNEFEIDGFPVWEADCEFDDITDPNDYKMIMVYRGKYKFVWYYSDVVNALDTGVDLFVKKFIDFEDVKKSHIDELEKFFTYWLSLAHNKAPFVGDDE